MTEFIGALRVYVHKPVRNIYQALRISRGVTGPWRAADAERKPFLCCKLKHSFF